MPLSYPCLGAVVRNLDFMKRQHLHSQFPSIRLPEERFGYSFGKIMIMETTNNVVLLLGPLVVVFRLSGDRRSGFHTEVHYSDMRMSGQEFAEKTFRVDGLSVNEAAKKWVEYYLDRNQTKVEQLELRETPHCIENCRALRVDTLLLWCQPNPSVATWFPSVIPPKQVRTEWENMLTDRTVATAKHFQWRGSRKLSNEQLISLNCQTVDLFCHVDADEAEGYCREICRFGMQVGYMLRMRRNLNLEGEKLEKMMRKMEAKQVDRDKFELEIGSFSKLVIWRNGEENWLVVRVEQL